MKFVSLAQIVREPMQVRLDAEGNNQRSAVNQDVELWLGTINPEKAKVIPAYILLGGNLASKYLYSMSFIALKKEALYIEVCTLSTTSLVNSMKRFERLRRIWYLFRRLISRPERLCHCHDQ